MFSLLLPSRVFRPLHLYDLRRVTPDNTSNARAVHTLEKEVKPTYCMCTERHNIGSRWHKSSQYIFTYIQQYRRTTHLFSGERVHRDGAGVRAGFLLALAHGGAVQIAPAGAGRHVLFHGLATKYKNAPNVFGS